MLPKGVAMPYARNGRNVDTEAHKKTKEEKKRKQGKKKTIGGYFKVNLEHKQGQNP